MKFVSNVASFTLISYFPAIFWFWQDDILRNCFRFIFLKIVRYIRFTLHYWYRITVVSLGDTNKIIGLVFCLFFLHRIVSHYSFVRLPISVTKSLSTVFNMYKPQNISGDHFCYTRGKVAVERSVKICKQTRARFRD